MDARPYELPPAPILQALGTLLLSYSELEETLRFVIADEFTQHADADHTLIAEMPFCALVEKFGALYQDRLPPPESRGDIRAFSLRLSDLHDRRDELVHATWLQWDTGETHRASARPRTGSRTSGPRVLSATDILTLTTELDLASNRLVEYWSALRSPGVLAGRS